MAIDQMQRYKIPASITLAQGLIESGAGQSRLAREAHNHFGIKVGLNWTGPYIVMSDDRPNDRFRKYRTDDESYEDHSRFLLTNQRYRSLFNLALTDYRGWANGLKRCGYATNPRYPEMLIGTIERYNLQQFDSFTSGRYHARSSTANEAKSESEFFDQHIVYRVNKTYMIIANATDTWEKVAHETGVSKRTADFPLATSYFWKRNAPRPTRALKVFRMWCSLVNRFMILPSTMPCALRTSTPSTL